VAGIAAGQYILSGNPNGTGTFLVDDKLEIFLNGQLLHADPVAGRGYRQPIPFNADIGDQLRFVVTDTVLPANSPCPGLSTLYLIDPQGKSTVATPGFYIGCPPPVEGGPPRPGQGLVFDTTFTIPDIAATAPPYKQVPLPGSAFAGPLLLNGALYGVTYDGGNGGGTIYRASPDLSQVETLYSFPGNGGSDQLGVPYDELTPSGNAFFGIASSSPNIGGAIFKFDIDTGNVEYLIDVSWFSFGALSGPLLLHDGYLYGSARGFSDSKIFRIPSDGSSTTPEILKTFDDSEGRGPGGLTVGPDGFLYGTAGAGGNFSCYSTGCGTVFRLRPNGQDFEVLHVFNTFLGSGDASADSFPQRKLVRGTDNRLYGTTFRGVFSLAPAAAPADFTFIYALGNQDGSQIFAPPTEGPDGRIYVAQYDGGIDVFGSVYSMTKSGGNVVMHHQFSRNGQAFLPYGQPAVDGAGTIYGTTEYSDTAAALGHLFAIRTVSGNNQPPIANATAPANVTATASCQATVQLNGSGSSDPNGDALTYSWTENGVPIATGSTPSVQLGIGTHTIRLTVSDPAGTTGFDEVTVTVTNATTVAYVGPGILQSQGTNVLEASVTGASGPIAGAGIVFTVNGTPFPATSDGTGIARVTIGGLAGSSAVIQIDYPSASCGGATQTVTRQVNRWPTLSPSGPSPVFAGANCTAAVALAANASDLDGDTLTYVWSEGGVTFSTLANPTAALAPGMHTIDVAVSDGKGGTSSGSVVIDVRKALIGLNVVAPLPQFVVGIPVSISVRLSDISDAPIPGAALAFTLTGSSASATTDANGIATVSLTPGNNGFQELTVSYDGDTCRNASTFKTNVTVALPTATLLVTTVVTNNNGGNLGAADFTTTVLAPSASPSTFAGSATGVSVTVSAGSYQVIQPGRPEYVTTMSADCSGAIAGGEKKSCTITNDDKPTTLTLNKQVVNNNGGLFQPSAWTLHANGVPYTQGQATPVTPGEYALGESGPSGYTPSAWNCVGGSLVGSTLTIAPNTEVSCTIVNDDQPATLTLTKFVQNDNGGTRSVSDWQLTASGQIFVSGISQVVGAGAYLLSESGPGGYAPSAWSCTGSGSLTGSTLTLAPGQAASCSITNDDIAPGNSMIAQLGPGTGSAGPLLLTAKLRDSTTGQPLRGRTLVFTLGNQTTAAPTDFQGVASAPLMLAQAPGRLALRVTFAGDTVYAPAQATRSFEVVVDTDGDGLPDSWETNGVDLTGDGTIDLPLPAMGANPLRKDLFVEVDWMVKPEACVWLVCWTNGGVLQPQRAVLDALVARFMAAPVTNPDGSTGISLHVDGGPDTIMNPVTGEPWGAFSRAGVVPYDAVLGEVNINGEYDWSEFDALKQVFLEPARRPVFHYAIYADVMADTNIVGLSRDYIAADFIVAAGHPDWNGGLTVTQEASLFVHELGHNLGLRHGGGDDFNYKPNYFSAMNYLWTLIGVPPDNRPDYSSVAEPAIDETVAGEDVNDDGLLTTLTGFLDWPNLVYTGGGIGDLFALPPPVTTPIEPIDPVEMRERGIYARDGDGLIHFRGPSVLVRDSGVRSLSIDVKNISTADASYTVSAEGALVGGSVSAATSVPGGSLARVTLPVDTTGLVPGEYAVIFTLRSDTGEILHRQPATIVVVDLSVPENQEAARAAMAALAALPPGSGLDPAVLEQIAGMFEEVMPSWTAEVRVSGRVAFDTVYRIEEPAFPRNPGRFTVRSLPGAPLLVLDIMRAGKAVNGTVQLQEPAGQVFQPRIAGRWDELTHTFDGHWVDGKGRGGSIWFRLQEP
jgi:uncharacterized repeat protein (TIGR03803 family)